MAVGADDAMLEEYRQLKAEILKIFDRRSALFNVAATISSALLAAGIAAKRPEITALSSLISSAIWIDDNKSIDNMDRIGAYIRVAIEPAFPGLAWEKAHQKAMQARSSAGFARRLTNVFVYRYPVLSLASYAVTLLLISNRGYTFNELLLTGTLLVISILLFIAATTRNMRGAAGMERWNDAMRTTVASIKEKSTHKQAMKLK